MKARIKGSDKPFQEIDTVQFKDSWNMVKVENLEFQPSVLARVVSNDNHWQEVKEKAAIAAMQGMFEL